MQRRVYESVQVPCESSINLLNVQRLFGCVLGILCASSVYYVFNAVTLCIMYHFLLEAGLLSFV